MDYIHGLRPISLLHGLADAWLLDGIMDTVTVEITCRYCGNTWRERFSDTSFYRDSDGCLTEENLEALMDDYDVYCTDCNN